MSNRKQGRFTISRDVLFDPDKARKLMRGIVVFHTEARFDCDEITYFATHPDFREIDLGTRAPEYVPILENDTVSWTETTQQTAAQDHQN